MNWRISFILAIVGAVLVSGPVLGEEKKAPKYLTEEQMQEMIKKGYVVEPTAEEKEQWEKERIKKKAEWQKQLDNKNGRFIGLNNAINARVYVLDTRKGHVWAIIGDKRLKYIGQVCPH